jgi:hypothetical protein
MNPQPPSVATDARPVLMIDDYYSPPAAKIVISAMRAAGDFCIRSTSQDRIDLWKRTESGSFRRIRAAELRSWIATHFRCVKFDYKSKTEVPANPPPSLSGWIMLELGVYGGLPYRSELGKR